MKKEKAKKSTNKQKRNREAMKQQALSALQGVVMLTRQLDAFFDNLIDDRTEWAPEEFEDGKFLRWIEDVRDKLKKYVRDDVGIAEGDVAIEAPEQPERDPEEPNQ